MMKLGANSVLFGGHSMESAFRGIAMAGYDGIELSAIDGMSEHLVLDRWEELVPEIRDLSEEYRLELLAMEQPRRDPEVMDRACRAASALGIPVVNCGPGGTTGDEESLKASIKSLSEMATIGEEHGVTVCVKAHVGASIYNTPTTLRVMEAIDSPCVWDRYGSVAHPQGRGEPRRGYSGSDVAGEARSYSGLQRYGVRSGQAGGSSEWARGYRFAGVRSGFA